jgi:hypothetical protein
MGGMAMLNSVASLGDDLRDLQRKLDRITWLLAANILLELIILVRLSYVDF